MVILAMIALKSSAIGSAKVVMLPSPSGHISKACPGIANSEPAIHFWLSITVESLWLLIEFLNAMFIGCPLVIKDGTPEPP